MAKDTREDILEAAEELFRESGMDAVSMRAIAERTGLSAPAAYYYFASKEALVEAMILRGFGNFRAGLEARRQGLSDPRRRLELTLSFYLEFWRSDPQAFRYLSERGIKRGYLGKKALEADSFGDIPALVAEVLGATVASSEAARIGRWTVAALFGVALSLYAPCSEEDPPSDEDIRSAARFLLAAVTRHVNLPGAFGAGSAGR